MPNYKPKSTVPRLCAWLGGKLFDNKPLIMAQETWNSLKSGINTMFEIDIFQTPICNLKISSIVIGCIVRKITEFEYKVKVYRFDTKDNPPYNVDTYSLIERFDLDPNFPSYVNRASTNDDTNMRNFITETVMLFNIGPDEDHHSSFEKLPKIIQEKIKTMCL